MEHYLSLARAAKERGVSQDYLRFLIFKKKLQGLKIGRNWVTTNAWLDTYVEHNGHAKFKSNASLPKPADPLSVIPASAGIQNNDKRKSFAKTFLQSVYDAIPRVRQATALIAVAATSLALGTFAIHASKKIDLRMLEPFASEDAWFSPSQGVAALIRVNDRLHTALGAALRETGQDIAVVPRTLASAVELFPDIHLADSLQRANVLDAIGKPFQKLIDPLGIALCQTLYHSCGAVAPLVRKLSPSPTPKDVGSLTESARGVSLSSTTPTTGGFRTPVNEHITEITRVREVVERTAVQNVIPVDLAVLKRNVLADVASINNSIRTEFENTIQGLRDRMNGTGVQFVNIGVQPSTNTIAPVVLSQKIDQLHDVVLYSPTVQSGITVASGGISVSGGIIGNLGIGTTSPSQLLSIAGHCVTGDTRLRRRRRRKNADGTDSDEYDYDEVPIKDIQPGDEIASLNEATGKIIWSKVNALMDMGVKPIYKLTTAGGKTIRTTGEHPYLVRVENQKAPRLTWDSLTRWAVDSHHTRRGEQSGFQSVTRLSGFTHQAHRTADYIMHQNENNPEIAFRTVFSSLWSVVLPIENQYIQYITRENLVKHAPVDNQNPSFSTGSKNNLATAMGSIARGNVSVKQGLWTKVHALAEGQEIAVSSADGKVAIWDRIEKIEHLPAEQVYDIEVEGTHNFIGNGIVAHNTYLTGGLGVGRATTTSNMLDVAGNGVFGGFLSASTFNATSTTATSTLSTGGLTVGTSQFVVQQTAGNVGIGTTSPAQLLSIAGHCVTGDTRLRRRRRRKGKNGEWIEEFDEVAIKDIQQGDEILTLDDASGTFVWRQVKGLMDMGVKQTYALITGTGKLIRTTASHPYFVRPIAHDGATIQKSTYAYAEQLARAHYFAKLHGRTVRVPALENSEVVFTRSGWEHFLEKKRSLNELITRFFALPRVETALAHASRGVAYQKREKPGMLVEYWTIEEIVEYVLVRVVVCAINNGPKFFLSCAWLGTKELEGIPANKKQLSLSEEKSPRRRRGMDTPQLFVPSLYSQRLDVSRGMWKKVAQLSTDYEVATVDGWEHIIAITPVAHEQVYDIEVEGTHNFIGNDIVAHNTYLTGGLGAGVVETGAGNITGTGRLSITSTTATSTFSTGGLTVGTSQFVVQQTAGNVGIGTTSPGTLVAIHGSAPILTLGDSQSSGAQYRLRNGSITAGTFDIYDNGAAASRLSINNAGNVGIGTTSPSAKFAFTGDGTGATRAFVIADSSNVERVSILNNGNVGIGTTGPLALLDVNGVSAAGLGAVGAPSFAIRTDLDTGMWSSGANTLNFSTGGSERVRFDSNGNVGIGTTSPAQLLSIAGHCVTGDTRLRRRRRKTRRRQGYGGRGKKANGEGEDEYDYDEVQIKDIKQGDEIASLDEQTGQIVWSKVKALMDMGVKPIYKLTTASGKTIRTTAEHPYLVKTSDPELPKKKPRLGVFFDNANMFYAQRDAGWRIDIIRLKRALEAQFDMAFFNHYHAVPVEGDPARQPTLDFMQSVGEEITFRTKPLKYIQTADGIKKKGDMDVEIALDVTERIGELDAVLAVSGDSDLLPLRYYAAQRGKKIAFAGFRRNMAWELTKFGKYTYLDEYRASLGRGEKINSKPELGVALVRLLYSRPPSLSSGGLWIKAAEIHEGQMVAVKGAGKTAVWDRVVSIEHTPAEQVYDIEVEGTHNFIGNDIVAHNTYLTGGLGAGVVETGAGNITGTGRLSITSTTATSTFSTGGLTVGTSQFVVQQTSGNVGIGTTSPGTLVAIHGSAPILTLGDSQSSGAQYRLRNGSITAGTFDIYDNGAAASRLSINNAGNVGIGTTSPAQLLSIAGHCVTGDTLLKRRKKRKKKDGTYEDDFEDVRIDEIQPGDEILTLDERTGNLVWSRVNALMDMGVKPIYRLVTASGKTIRTTGEHPYLIAPDFGSARAAVFIDGANFEKSIAQINGWADYPEMARSFGQDILRFYQVRFGTKGQDGFFARLKHLGFSLITKPLKTITERGKDDEQKANFDVELAVDAVDLKDRYDIAVLFSGDSDFVYLANYLQKKGKQVVVVSPWRRTARELRLAADVYLNLKQMPFVKAIKDDTGDNQKRPRGADHDRLSPALSILSQIHPYVKGGLWKKAAAVRAGDMIATRGTGGKPIFERIIKIEKTAPEQVYDIEVEGTHNFIGNDIVAHNTYLTGGLGAGVVETTNGNITGTGRLSITSTTATSTFSTGGLTVGTSQFVVQQTAGNVGIGTTSPASLLSVQGNGYFSGTGFFGGAITGTSTLAIQSTTATSTFSTGGLTVGTSQFVVQQTSGNVGIGTTSPSARLSVTSAGTGTGRAFGVADSANTERFTILDNGNVGIGSTTPGSLLSLAGRINWNNSLGAITHLLGPTDQTFALAAGARTSGAGNSITITASNSVSESNAGGNITLQSGNGFGSNAGGSAGSINILGGSTTVNNAGAINITGGAGTAGAASGGIVTITGGAGGGVGGHVALVSGTAPIGNATGNITLTTSNSAGGGPQAGTGSGNILLTTGNNLNGGGSVGYIGLTAGSVAANNPIATGYITMTTGGYSVPTGGSVTTGAFTLTIPAGPNAPADSNHAGNGGAITLTGGAGGSTSFLSSNAGNGSSVSIIAGAGGAATGNGAGGSGGSLTLRAGAEGSGVSSNGTAGQLIFQTGGASTRMLVDGNGNVGIGTTSPYGLLTLYKAGSTAAASPQLVFSASSTVANLNNALNNWAMGTDFNDGGKFKIASSSVIGTNDRFVIDGNGNLGIGTTSPSAKFAFTGDGTGATRAFVIADSSNVERVSILNNGNLGIGTTSPGTLLALHASAPILTLGDSQSSGAQYRLRNGSVTAGTFDIYDNGAAASRLSINNAGNVGIGTTTPQRKLTITNAGANGQLLLTDTGAVANSHYGEIGFSQGAFSINTMTDALATTTRMVIDTNGNVGIGTTGPDFKLKVVGAVDQLLRVQSTSGNALIDIQSLDSGGVAALRFADTTIKWELWKDTNGFFQIRDTTAGARLLINTSGNVGIGTTSPGTLVAIHGSAPILTLGDSQSSGAQYRLRNGSITAGTFDIYDNGAAASRLSINNAGNVGIGTTSPWRTESVVGTIGWSSSLGTGTGGNYLCIDTTTFEVLRGNGAACTASSLRFKENVQDIKYGLSDVLKLHPVSYTYKPETNMGTGTKLGFIADEMQSVIPEVVTLDKDGKVFGLDYPVLTSILAKAIQELDAKINALSLSSGSTTTPDSLMVKKIASSLGNWSIDEDGTLMAVKIITDEIVTQKLTVGSASKPSGITIYDEVTKEPYCIKVRNGAMVSEAGICGNQNDKGQMTNQAQSSNDQSTATAAPSTPVEPVASSTPAATETAATSTSPVSETIATSTGGLTP